MVVLFTTSYTVALFIVSRRRRTPRLAAPRDLYFVFMVPCLNEEVVIGRTIERLLQIPGKNFSIVVIDDGSQDDTANVVRSYSSERVLLFQRIAPEARQGKGRALNACFRYIRDSGVLGHRRHEDVITCILDADGRVEENVLHEVGPYFRDPKMGAVQIGVRMYNVSSLLTRVQDFEFVTFTEIFQRARMRFGSVGLGGNGQFTRLAALRVLGDSPWTDCLTEDLDLGVRLAALGWTNNFCPTTYVSQQAVTGIRRLIRQRSRWFQGHLQCWKRIPLVIRSPHLSARASADFVYHLSSPALILIFTAPMLIFFAMLITVTISSPDVMFDRLTANGGRLLIFWYLLSFGLAPFYGFTYWLREKDISFVGAVGVAHAFNLYSYLWFAAGWMAVWRILTKKRGWAKTTRSAEPAA